MSVESNPVIANPRQEYLKLRSKYSLNEKQERFITESEGRRAMEHEELPSLTTEVQNIEARAAAFNQLTNFVQSLKTGGILSGAVVFNALTKLRIIQPGMTKEENEANFERLFDNIDGDDKALAAFREVSRSIFRLTTPYLELYNRKQEIEFAIKTEVLKNYVEKFPVKKVNKL